MLKGKKLGGLLPSAGEGGPEAAVVSDEDEAAEMEDEAVRSRVQHKAKVGGGAAGGGGTLARPPCSAAATQTLCPSLSCLSPSLCLGFWLSQHLLCPAPPHPHSDSNPGLPAAPRRTRSG